MNTSKFYTLDDYLKKRLKDPGFKKAWADTEVEYQLACRMIEARLAKKMSQRDLARKVKTSQAAISRIESMNANPSLSFLKRIAAALETKFTITL